MSQNSIFAIIQLAGKQFLVEEGMSLIVPRLAAKEGDKFSIPDVLLVNNGTNCSIGNPTISEANVSAVVSKHQRAKKIRVATYKAKSRHRRVLGHKQPESLITIKKISLKKK